MIHQGIQNNKGIMKIFHNPTEKWMIITIIIVLIFLGIGV